MKQLLRKDGQHLEQTDRDPRARDYQPGDEDLAVADYQHALRLDPNFIPAYLGLAHIYEFKKSSLGMDLYTKSSTNVYAKWAIDYYSKAIQLQPGNVDWLLIQRGSLYERQKDYAHAIADYSAAIRPNQEGIIAYRFRASLYKELQEFAKAKDDYLSLIQLEPESVYTWQKLAEVFSAWQKYNEAVEAYTEALQRVQYMAQPYQSSTAAELLEARGDVFTATGANAAAQEDYQMAMKLDAGNAAKIQKKLQQIAPAE